MIAGMVMCGSYIPLLSALLHEAGHLMALYAASKRTGTRIENIRIGVLGADISCAGCASYGTEFVCAVSGGLMNLCGAAVSALLYRHGGLDFHAEFALSCIGLAAFNLLPALPLDGGIALRALLRSRLGYDTGSTAASAVSKCVAAAMALAAGYMLFYGIGGYAALPLCAMCVLCWNESELT